MKSEEKYSYKISLGSHDSRLKRGSAKEVLDYIYLRRLKASIPFFEPMIQYNLAHMVELYEKEVISKDDAAKIVQTLRWIKEQGLEHFELDPNLETLMPNIEAILISKLGEEVGGKVLTGRARGDVTYVSAILLLRGKILDLLEEVHSLRKLILEQADRHANTLMPGYTHLQHAQPSTLGHYLACVAEAFETDCKRLEDAYKRLNMSPAEVGAGWGTGYPIDRKRVSDLLGFEGMIENTRYAMISCDRGIEALAAFAILTVNINRFSEDIYFWCTYEYGFVDIADEYASTSYIMPQKKNPNPLEEFTSVTNRTVTALSRSATQASRSSFGIAANLSVSFVDSAQTASIATDDIAGAIKLLRGIVSTLTFNEDIMKERAGIHYTQSTELADTLFREKDISFRTAHRIVGALVRESIAQRNKPSDIDTQMLDKASVEITGKPIKLPYDILRKALDPMEVIKARNGLGGVSTETVRESLENRFRELNKDIESLKEKRKKLKKGQEELEKAIKKLISPTEKQQKDSK